MGISDELNEVYARREQAEADAKRRKTEEEEAARQTALQSRILLENSKAEDIVNNLRESLLKLANADTRNCRYGVLFSTENVEHKFHTMEERSFLDKLLGKPVELPSGAVPIYHNNQAEKENRPTGYYTYTVPTNVQEVFRACQRAGVEAKIVFHHPTTTYRTDTSSFSQTTDYPARIEVIAYW